MGFALQRVVELLRAIEKRGCALDLPPASFDANGVHHQCKRRKNLADAAAIECRVEVDDVSTLYSFGLLQYALSRGRADQRLVLLERMQTKSGLIDDRECYRHRLLGPSKTTSTKPPGT